MSRFWPDGMPIRVTCDALATPTSFTWGEHRHTVEQIIGFARRLDPGLTDRDFADAAERLDHWGDTVFASFGLGPDGIAELRARFAAWPRT